MQASPFEIIFLLASIKFLISIFQLKERNSLSDFFVTYSYSFGILLISINMMYLLECLTMTDSNNASTFKLTMHALHQWFSLQLYSVGICTAHKVVKIH